MVAVQSGIVNVRIDSDSSFFCQWKSNFLHFCFYCTWPKWIFFLDDCQIWGGQHYRTFDGIFYNFFENCTHILVQEIIPKYNFTVILDNYYCTSSAAKSCQQTLIIHYQGNVIYLTTGHQPSVSNVFIYIYA